MLCLPLENEKKTAHRIKLKVFEQFLGKVGEVGKSDGASKAPISELIYRIELHLSLLCPKSFLYQHVKKINSKCPKLKVMEKTQGCLLSTKFTCEFGRQETCFWSLQSEQGAGHATTPKTCNNNSELHTISELQCLICGPPFYNWAPASKAKRQFTFIILKMVVFLILRVEETRILETGRPKFRTRIDL